MRGLNCLFLLFISLQATVSAIEQFDFISSVIRALQLRHCLVICPLSDTTTNKQLLSEKETHWPIIESVEQVMEEHLRSNDMLMCVRTKREAAKMIKEHSRWARYNTWVFLVGLKLDKKTAGLKLDNTKDLKLDIRIDEKIYLLDANTLQLSERYRVNGREVDRVLGVLQWEDERQFAYRPFVTENFLARRSDFQGSVLRGLTERQPPYTDFNYQSSATTCDNSSKLIDVTQMPQEGLFPQLLLLMQVDLNFSTQTFLRRDRKWGNQDPGGGNGNWTGMMGDLVGGAVDIITTSLSLSLDRNKAVHYLPAISKETFALVIKRSEQEELVWNTFVHPLAPMLWMVVVVVSVITLLVLKLLQWHYCYNFTARDLLGGFNDLVDESWTVFCSNFGRPPDPRVKYDNRGTMKVMLFVTFLVGNLVFMSYNASLTSALSVRDTKMPFSSLEELLTTRYGLMIKDGGLTAESFKTATDGIFRDLYQQKMKPDPSMSFFASEEAALMALNQSSTSAYYGPIESVVTFTAFQCAFVAPWTSQYPNHLSMALSWDSPLYPFMHYNLIRQYEMGTLSLLNRRYMTKATECSAEENLSLGMEKLVSLFAMLLVGFAAALAIFILERAAMTMSGAKDELLENQVKICNKLQINDKCYAVKI